MNKHLINSASSAAAKIITIGVSFMTMPIIQREFGGDLFGVWVIILSLSALLNFADFGMGNSLIGLVAASKNNKLSAQKNISAVFSAVCIIAVIISFSSEVIASLVIKQIKNLDEENFSNAVIALKIFILNFAVAMPLNIAIKIQVGLNKSYYFYATQVLASLVAYFLVLICIKLNLNFYAVMMAYVIPNTLLLLTNNIIFFAKNRLYMPKIEKNAKNILFACRVGSAYFFLQLIAAIHSNADNFVIASSSGASATGDYAILQRIFGMVSVMGAIILQPLWPIYSLAAAEKNFLTIKKQYKKYSCVVMLLSVLFGGCFYLFGSNIIYLWFGKEYNISPMLLLGFFAYYVVDMQVMSLATLLNGLNILWPQVFYGIIFCFIIILGKVFLVKSYGVVYMPLYGAGVFFIYCLVMHFQAQKYFRSSM